MVEEELARIKKLEDYLVANGFNNYVLTDEEKLKIYKTLNESIKKMYHWF